LKGVLLFASTLNKKYVNALTLVLFMKGLEYLKGKSCSPVHLSTPLREKKERELKTSSPISALELFYEIHGKITRATNTNNTLDSKGMCGAGSHIALKKVLKE
jgi:hypothetical protein